MLLLACVGSLGSSANAENRWGHLDYRTAVMPTGQVVGSVFATQRAVPQHKNELLRHQSTGVIVDLNWDVIYGLDSANVNRVSFPVFNGQTFEFDGRTLELALLWSDYRDVDDYTWYGEIAGVAASDVIFVCYKDAVYMEVRDYESGTRYQLQGIPGGMHALREVDGSRAAGAWCGVDGRHAVQPPGDQGHAADAGPRGTVTDPTDVIDIMTCCTAQALANFGSVNNFVATSQAAVADFNLRHLNSYENFAVTLRLVAADASVTSGYNETSDGELDLERLAYSNDGFMEDVHAARDLYEADLVALIRYDQWGSSGGIAFRSLHPSLGFSVNVMNHSSLSLVGDIFAHEVGHNLNLVHDLETYTQDQAEEGEPAPILTDRHGKRDVSSFCCSLFGDKGFHTTMAYGFNDSCGGSTLIPMFSTPTIEFDPGSTCSTFFPGRAGIEFCALYIENTGAPAVSQHRISATLQWTAPGANGTGTFLSPRGSIGTAIQLLQGDYIEASVRAKTGSYNETFLGGGTAVFDLPARIIAHDGPVVIN